MRESRALNFLAGVVGIRKGFFIECRTMKLSELPIGRLFRLEDGSGPYWLLAVTSVNPFQAYAAQTRGQPLGIGYDAEITTVDTMSDWYEKHLLHTEPKPSHEIDEEAHFMLMRDARNHE
jgi:hypothetical protein